MLEKRKILEVCIKVQQKKIEDLEKALRRIKQEVIDAPTSRQSWSDTTRFQQGNLALTVENSLQEAKSALSQIRTISNDVKDTIFIGSLFILNNVDTGEVEKYLLIPKGGGDSFSVGDEEIILISAEAPLVKLLLGKKKGDKVAFRDRTLEVVDVR